MSFLWKRKLCLGAVIMLVTNLACKPIAKQEEPSETAGLNVIVKKIASAMEAHKAVKSMFEELKAALKEGRRFSDKALREYNYEVSTYGHMADFVVRESTQMANNVKVGMEYFQTSMLNATDDELLKINREFTAWKEETLEGIDDLLPEAYKKKKTIGKQLSCRVGDRYVRTS